MPKQRRSISFKRLNAIIEASMLEAKALANDGSLGCCTFIPKRGVSCDFPSTKKHCTDVGDDNNKVGRTEWHDQKCAGPMCSQFK